MNKNISGFTTLMGVLVFGAISTSLVLTMLLLSVLNTKTNLDRAAGVHALYGAHACGEEALEIIRENPSFVGSGTLTLGEVVCTFTVTHTGVEARSIASSASVGTIIQRIEIQIDDISPQINVTSWQEVADF